MESLTLDWDSIRPLNGGRDKGFEELCAQLARAECPAGSHFIRKGTPDAGVECYTILSNGSEWGWQAKYFDTLGDSQWSQIDGSVETAIDKHPRLERYFVCVPLDRPDARIVGRKSAMERWDEHVKTWTNWTSNKGMTVEFVYWGSHELLERLARPEHIGRVHFWFGVRGFDGAWFSARLDEAIRAAGARYTPEVHVDLKIAKEFDAFGRTDRFFDSVKTLALNIRTELRSVERTGPNTDYPTLDTAIDAMSSKVKVALNMLGVVEVQPIGALPFKDIAEQIGTAETAVEELEQLLMMREQETRPEGTTGTGEDHSSYKSNPIDDRRVRLLRLSSELQTAHEALDHAAEIAGNALMLLNGDAGTGKTHLLCDVARQRVAAGRPTVLLMGQRFTGTEAPWTQALQQMDMAGLTAEEFVGSLEAAAQAAGSRALLIIDAINEGTGRIIWPSHLAAFLALVERSAWVGVVLSVRSSYEDIVVPRDVRERAVRVIHPGFTDHEYNAAKTFFIHYGLELPSTPLLAPEFRNPLFLKSLCSGLNKMGERRLPRGFHGITAVFDLYLNAVNGSLATALGFNQKTRLVQQALEVFTQVLLDSEKHWISLAKAEEIVNALLPDREYERSLYRGLIVEGVLAENVSRRHGGEPEEVVYIAYERFADHQMAKLLLDRHLGVANPASIFTSGGPLAFLCDKSSYVAPGLLEALCIQIPERTGQEFVSLTPTCIDRWGMGDAFRQSLIWRDYKTFTDETLEVLNKLLRNDHDLQDTLDVLLTVATLPGHPLNAMYLDQRLRKDTMPNRDAWWSIYLHRAWNTSGAVDRLVDWAYSVAPDTVIDDEMVDLCATSLSWMLTTSNRPLRDRATQALVNLLTGRLAAVTRLIKHFADVDDLYVVERMYAVAYGVSMRCNDPVAVEDLAICVYTCAFATGNPPTHILLRDYARGVIEHALHLGSAIEVDTNRIRPPYLSKWPTIPTEEEIKPLLPDWSRGSYDSGESEWGRNRIGSSVMDDDFARYVIGTNSSSISHEWLSLRLDEPLWTPPPRPEDKLRSLVAEFSDVERKTWELFEAADLAKAKAFQSFVADWTAKRENDDISGQQTLMDSDTLAQELEKAYPPEVETLAQIREDARSALDATLSNEHRRRLEEILSSKEYDRNTRLPPRFNLGQIQRYILWRVFNLGWTTERFGDFDRYIIGNHGREASKTERIGKKYQWIAYHEIMALVADHFQYREPFGEEDGDMAYEGPWQVHLRDIDPSCTIRDTRGGTSWDGHAAAWWGSAQYDKWGDPGNIRDWILNYNNLPKVEDLLTVTNPLDGSRWFNGQGYFNWIQPTPPDRESMEIERCELWYICNGYLIKADDAQPFLTWAEGIDFSGRWMPDPAEVYRMFLGEHAWAPASRYFQQQYYGDEGWTQPNNGCPVKIRNVAFGYLREATGFDCSIDETYKLWLPVSELVTGLKIRWSGSDAKFVDSAGKVAAYDPTVDSEGPDALLLREDVLREFLAREKLTICWVVIGEKRVISLNFGDGSYPPALRISGAYVLSEGVPIGFVKYILDDPNAKDAALKSQVVGTVRNGPKS